MESQSLTLRDVKRLNNTIYIHKYKLSMAVVIVKANTSRTTTITAFQQWSFKVGIGYILQKTKLKRVRGMT